MTLAVFMGQKTSGGYKIEITKIAQLDSALRVFVTRYYGGGGSMLPVLTSPYHIVQIPKGDYKIEIEYKDQKEN
jgi:hypothetical protein